MLIECVEESIQHRRALFEQGVISLSDSLIISDEESTLLIVANRAANMMIAEVLTDMAEPGKILDAVTADLQRVIRRLRNLNQFLGMFAGLVNLFNRIIATVAAGPGAIAQIGPLYR